MKKIGILIIVLAIGMVAWAANTKVTEMAEVTAVIGADLLYLVDDVAGTATESKITVLNLFDTIDTSAELLDILQDETGTGIAVFGTSPQFTTTMTTAGVFAINPGGALTIGDNGDTLVLNSSDWDIGPTGIATGMGAITSDGAFVTTANAITLGDTGAGDPVITFDSTNDGTIKWEEDGQDFEMSGDLELGAQLRATSGVDLGTSQALVGTTAITVGNHGQTIAIDSSDWDIGATGIMTGMGNITSDGTITDGTGSFVGGELLDFTTLEATTTLGIEIGDVQQLVLTDGKLNPTTDNDIDLGDATHQFKDAFINGTLEADAITEGGNAVYSSGETPSGELGGTYANITIDDSVAVSNWNLTTPTVTTGITITGADHNPAAAGEIRYDSTVAGMSGGGLRWYDDDSVRIIVDLETDATDDDHVVAYDAVADGFYMKDDDDTGGATAYDDIGDPDAAGSIAFDAAEGGTYTSSADEWVGITISNTQANLTGATELLTLAFTDDGDTNSHYLIMSDAAGTQQLEFIQNAADVVVTTAGDLKFVAGGGDFDFADDNVTTTGTVSGGSVTDGTATLNAGSFTGIVGVDGSGTISANLFTPDAADGADIGSATLEFSDIYLADGSIIKGQNDQSNTITSSATGWTFALDVTVSGGNINTGNIPLVIGDATTDTIQLLTDGTGNAEILLPDDTIGDSEIDWANLTDLAAGGEVTWSNMTSAEIESVITNDAIDFGTGVVTAAGFTLAQDENITLNSQTIDHDNTDFVFSDSVNLGANALKTTANIAGEPKHMRFNIFDPLAVQTADTQVCIVPLTDAAITITNIKITLDAAGNEIVGDLMFADTFIGLANATVINICDTTAGVLDDSAMGDGTVPATKCIYFQFDSAPHTDITQMIWDITFDYD